MERCHQQIINIHKYILVLRSMPLPEPGCFWPEFLALKLPFKRTSNKKKQEEFFFSSDFS